MTVSALENEMQAIIFGLHDALAAEQGDNETLIETVQRLKAERDALRERRYRLARQAWEQRGLARFCWANASWTSSGLREYDRLHGKYQGLRQAWYSLVRSIARPARCR